MALNKYKLGRFIEKLDNKNSDLRYGVEYAVGVSNEKELMPTKADLNGRNLAKFSIIYPGDFVYNHRTSRHGDKFCIAYNATQENLICTEDYTIFRIKDDCKNKLLNEYLYMFFHRPEMDRFVMYSSWGSSTEFFNWDDVCDIDIELPDLPTQQKYVDIYNAMVVNQQSYERGFEDLKLVCDGYVEELRLKMPCKKIGKYIECTDRKTDDSTLKIQGISNQQKLNDSNSRVDGVDTGKYLRIDPREFGYSPIHINDGSIAFNNSSNSYLLSPIYKTFKVLNEDVLNSEYLMMWFTRNEFIRYCKFHAFGSARDTFEWEQLCKIKIPVPSIEVQKSIANIYITYMERKEINNQLKAQIKDICPILIKGSLEEGRNGNI